MQIIKGKFGGFCFGVKRAVDKAVSLQGGKNFVLGEIIHNEEVVEKLKKNGVKVINSLEEGNFLGGETLLIRTHGEPKSTFQKAEGLNLNVIDCTCPFVKDIHKIVEENFNNGKKIVIIGDENHPEVKSINGWCENSALITQSANDVNSLPDKNVCVVVQTTFSEEKFEKIIKNFVNDGSKTLDIFKTICYTTTKRQQEASTMSKSCDAILVIGGEKSNNTWKLYEICKNNCQNTFRIINPSDFDYIKIKKFNKVGIVVGASTPTEQIQEVISKMENITEEIITTEGTENVEVKVEKSEMEMAFDRIKPSKNLHIGQIVTAKISSVTDNGLTISLRDIKSDFELPKEELLEEFTKENYKEKIGQDIRVMVIGKNPVRFSEKAMAKILAEEAEIEEIKNGKIFEVTITETNKGGLLGKFGSYSVFIPSSQIKLSFVKNLETYVGKT